MTKHSFATLPFDLLRHKNHLQYALKDRRDGKYSLVIKPPIVAKQNYLLHNRRLYARKTQALTVLTERQLLTIPFIFLKFDALDR